MNRKPRRIYASDLKGIGHELKHYGMPRRSGRYPWGSGKQPQRNRNIYNVYRQLKEESKRQGCELTDAQIAAQWGMSQTKLKALKSLGRDEQRAYDIARAKKLMIRCGNNKSEVGRRMGIPESTVRSLLNEDREKRTNLTKDTANSIKEFVDKNKYVDIGKGTEIALNVSPDRMKTAIEMLKADGYKTHSIYIDQMGTNYQTTLKCLVPPGVDYQELRAHRYDIKPVSDIVIQADGTRKPGPEPFTQIDSKRIAINYAEDGGVDKDGLIELRRGVKDLNLGKANYAQVRIGVEGTHYLKGMAVYADDLPDGIDIRFNTNKKRGTPMMGPKDNTVLKPQKSDPNNPFGASIKDDDKLKMVQSHYIDIDGKEKRSALNVVNEEGNWADWAKSLSSQFLSKQSVPLARNQLNQKYAEKQLEFEEIKSLTNNTLKKVLLEKFADGCDGAAVDLKAAALPGQASHVLIPCPSLKPNEIYAPKYKDGEHVILVRFPHASITEIPELVVNNKNAEARNMLGLHPTDAVGINKATADRMSGADFDGDSALVIPANNPGGKVRIRTAPQYEALKGFSTDEYALPPGHPESAVITTKEKGKQMGIVSNLITDMTLKGAEQNPQHMVWAIKHSMVVIDAEKHELDWKKSYEDNHIEELKKLYQQRPEIDPKTGENKYGGAGTIVSRAKSEVRVNERRAITGIIPYKVDSKGNSTGNTDPETGKIMKSALETGKHYTKVHKNGREEVVYNTQSSTKMAEAEDAFTLTSGGSRENPGHPMEGVYATFANEMKSLANEARKAYLDTPNHTQNPQAKKEYAQERKELLEAVLKAKMNAPKERQAQLLANKEVDVLKEEHPDMDYEHIQKAKGKAIANARKIVGAHKDRIDITDRQWEAIQAGAISHSVLLDVLNNTDLDKVKQRAMPRSQKVQITDAKKAMILSLANNYESAADIAEVTGISATTITKIINGTYES